MFGPAAGVALTGTYSLAIGHDNRNGAPSRTSSIRIRLSARNIDLSRMVLRFWIRTAPTIGGALDFYRQADLEARFYRDQTFVGRVDFGGEDFSIPPNQWTPLTSRSLDVASDPPVGVNEVEISLRTNININWLGTVYFESIRFE